MEKEIVNQVQEAQRVLYRINPRRNTPRNILKKLTKTKHNECTFLSADECRFLYVSQLSLISSRASELNRRIKF